MEHPVCRPSDKDDGVIHIGFSEMAAFQLSRTAQLKVYFDGDGIVHAKVIGRVHGIAIQPCGDNHITIHVAD